MVKEAAARVWRGSRRAGRDLVDGLFPHHCALCDRLSHRSLALCEECEGLLTFNLRGCQRCALPDTPPGGPPCPACRGGLAFDRVLAPLSYDATLAGLVGRWKYRRELALTALFADLWRRHAPAPERPDRVLPVPLHWRRLCWRGFNQGERLATALVRVHPALDAVPVDRRLLRRHRPTGNQAALGQRARRANVAGAFTPRGPCDNLHLAVVDDVCTTGATADAAARALKAAGARRVDLWCIARAPATTQR
ncbi:MAG TPA: amidophosphoribosyltransferase [Halieaceae bacterium]|nr:amidophosphoribosyltransferase [Halieaceae bacterium]